MAHNLRLIEKLRHNQHTKKTIEEIRKELFQYSHRLNNHRIKLPFDYISSKSFSRKPQDQKHERYFVISNAHKRRKSLFQKDTQIHSSMQSSEISRDLEDSMIIKKPTMDMIRKESTRKIPKALRMNNQEDLNQEEEYLPTNIETKETEKQLRRFCSQRLPALTKIKGNSSISELSPW